MSRVEYGHVASSLRSDDWAVVAQGAKLLTAPGSGELLTSLRSGIGIDDCGRLVISDRWGAQNGVRFKMRQNLALLLLSLGADSPISRVEALDLSGCSSLTDLSPLQSAGALRQLSLDGCSGLTDGSPLAALPSLRVLSARDTAMFASIPEATWSRLESLSIDVSEIQSLAPLAHARNMRRLAINYAGEITELSPLAALGRLETLSIDWVACNDVTPIGRLGSLKSLSIGFTAGDTDFTALSSLESLEELSLIVVGSTDLSRLLRSGSFPKLRALEIRCYHDTALSGWAGVRGAPALRELTLVNLQGVAAQQRIVASWFVPRVTGSWAHGSDASTLLGAMMLVDAAWRVGSRPNGWQDLRDTCSTAMERGGKELAVAALGSTLLGTDGTVSTTTTSPIRRLCERTGGDWLAEAVASLISIAHPSGHRP